MENRRGIPENDLVAVTSTDKNGDASFLACTGAPGRFYNYETGRIENRPGGWNQMAPSNLYARNQSFDDYTEDGQYIRSYPDYRLKMETAGSADRFLWEATM